MSISFIYNNVDSRETGIVVNKYRTDTLAADRAIKLALPKNDGFVYSNNKELESYPLEIECTVKDVTSVKIRKIKDLFKNRNGELILSKRPDNIYVVRLINSVEFNKIIGNNASFTLVFDVQPYSYLKLGRELISITNKQTIINPGNCSSAPIFTIIPQINASSSITINGSTMLFKGSDVKFIVDIGLEDVYSLNYENLNNLMNIESDFIGFHEGENLIEFTGISKLQCLPGWRER